MKRAIELAKKGAGYTNPNPLVGAVVVKDGRTIGEGWHERYGKPHAERNALAACTENPAGAELYVTLEPCCHHGKTPPCTEAVIAAGIARVFVGSRDPNPLVSGKGIQMLKQAGIAVEQDVMRQECDGLNHIFFHYINTGMPYTALKYAMTLDGKIATRTGKSQWITGEEARAHVQQLRHRYAGIMAGIGTVLQDDPRLTCRIPGGNNPVRILCDSRLRIPLDSAICTTGAEVPTIVATCEDLGFKKEKIGKLRRMGIEVIEIPQRNGHLDLKILMKRLGERKLDSVLVEGGGQLAAGLLEDQLIRKVYAYVAPKLFGGSEAKGPVAGTGVEAPEQAVQLKLGEIQRFKEDLLLEYEVK